MFDIRVAQVSYWRHYYDYDLTLASINIYPPCLILNFVYTTSPQQPNDGRPFFVASLARPRSAHRSLRSLGRIVADAIELAGRRIVAGAIELAGLTGRIDL